MLFVIKSSSLINKILLSGYLSTKRPGQKVSIKYIRNNLEKNVMVILKKINRINFYGMELRELNKNKKYKEDPSRGC